jgi:resuscitation-promoting factor RpfB
VRAKPPVLIQPTVTTSTLGDGPPPVIESDPPPPAPELGQMRQCDPNYTPCVPIDSDVDCAGGKGNGPSYVAGPVRVIKDDPYGLDRDHDGVGCEN